AKLATALTIYTAGHPTISSLRQNIASVSREPADLIALRAEVDKLDADYQAALDASAPASTTALGTDAAAPAIPRPAPSRRVTPDATDVAASVGVEYADPTSMRLRIELAELSNVRERTNSARAELATSQAGFKYRYNVIRPAQLPRNAIAPNVPAVSLAGVLASLLFAAMVAVAADLLGGRIIE